MASNFLFLAPAEWIYRRLAARRSRKHQKKPPVRLANCRVISVGNLTVGGTGKTPAVQFVARVLLESGARVAVVSRGYGGSLSKRGTVVSDGKTVFCDAREAGDEPLLHARALPNVPVVIGIDRVRAAQTVLHKFALDCLVLDDALGFVSLHRDLDLVLLDARNPIGNGHLLPRGTLREDVSALHRAGAILLTRVNFASPQELAATRELVRKHCDAPIFECEHAPAKLYAVNHETADDEKNAGKSSDRAGALQRAAKCESEIAPHENVNAVTTRPPNDNTASAGSEPKNTHRTDSSKPGLNSEARQNVADEEIGAREYSLEWLAGKTVCAASALADNAAFRATLETLGARVISHCSRRDHHSWRDEEIVAAARESAARGALALIVTEKDAVKIAPAATKNSALPILALRIELRITRGEEALRALICQIATPRASTRETGN